MIVKDIMNKNVMTVEPGATIQEAAEMMAEGNTKCVIVTEKEKLVGILTDWDFLSKVCAKAGDCTKMKVDDIMTEKVIVTGPDTDIDEAAKIMVEHEIKKLPIVMNNVLIGVVTAMEIVAAEPKLMEEISSLVLLSKKQKPVAG